MSIVGEGGEWVGSEDRQLMLDSGRDVCGNLRLSGEREGRITNGLGGYASGTIAGMLTRRYHGLLIAALQPPVGRTLLLSKPAFCGQPTTMPVTSLSSRRVPMWANLLCLDR